MATTTENYALMIQINADVTVSPHGLGKALANALSTMPDDTLDWVFEDGASKWDLNLYDQDNEGSPIGVARLVQTVGGEF